MVCKHCGVPDGKLGTSSYILTRCDKDTSTAFLIVASFSHDVHEVIIAQSSACT